ALRKRCLAASGWLPADVVSEASMSTKAFATSFDRDGAVQAPWFGIASGVYFGKNNLASHSYVYDFAFAIDADNGYHVTWYDGQGLEYRASIDGGRTWSKDEQISDEANSGILAADRQGHIHLVWVGSYDIYYQRWSADTGWGAAILLTKEFSRGKQPAMAVDA